MYIFLMITHVFVCFVLIAVILLQAGRGGGISDMVGGGQPQSILGTQTNAFMTRATEVCAVIFVITSLSLGIMSTQRGKSLVEKNRLRQALKTTIPAMPPASSKAPQASAQVPAAETEPTTRTIETVPVVPVSTQAVSPAAQEKAVGQSNATPVAPNTASEAKESSSK